MLSMWKYQTRLETLPRGRCGVISERKQKTIVYLIILGNQDSAILKPHTVRCTIWINVGRFQDIVNEVSMN